MSLVLLKWTWKKNWKLLLIFFAVLLMYMAVMIGMYNVDDMDAIMSMIELFPKDLMSAMGFTNAVTDLTGYLASWLYGMLMLAFPMVYCIILGNRLVAKMVDSGSFAYLLSTPKSRPRIIVTQGFYALASLVLLFSGVFGSGVLIGEIMLPGHLDIPAFLMLNLTTLTVNMAVIMIAFFASCLFNETKYSLGVGSGVPIVFLLLNMIGGTSANASILKNVSIYGWYDPIEVVRGGRVWIIDLIYLGIVAVLFVASVLVFQKKRLML